MRIYRTAQGTEEVEVEIPTVQVDDEQDTAFGDVPEPVSADTEWAMSITDDERVVAWLVTARKGGRLDGYGDDDLRQLIEAYGDMNDGDYSGIAFLYGASDLAKVVAGTQSVESGNHGGITEETVETMNDAVRMGWVSDDTARTVVNPTSGVVPSGKLRETGREKVSENHSSQAERQKYKYREALDSEGHKFVVTETFYDRNNEERKHAPTTKWKDIEVEWEDSPTNISISPTDMSELFGVFVILSSHHFETDDSTYGEDEGRSRKMWSVFTLSFMPTKAEMELFRETISVLDGLFSEGISAHDSRRRSYWKDNQRSTDTHRKKVFPQMEDDEILRSSSGAGVPNVTYEGFGEMPEVASAIGSLGNMEGVRITRSEAVYKSVFGNRTGGHGMSFTISPEMEYSEEDYNATIDTLARAGGDGDGLRLLEGLPKSVHGLMHRGVLGISDNRETWDGMTELFPHLKMTNAFIGSGYGNRKFRVMVNPHISRAGRVQPIAHELGHFIYGYMLEGESMFASESEEGNLANEWNRWYWDGGMDMDDIANEFVMSNYPKSKWPTEYFAEVASAYLMVSGEIAGQISGDKVAISPEAYEKVADIIARAYTPKKVNSGTEWDTVEKDKLGNDSGIKILDSNEKMADYGDVLKPVPNRPRLASTWLDRKGTSDSLREISSHGDVRTLARNFFKYLGKIAK